MCMRLVFYCSVGLLVDSLIHLFHVFLFFQVILIEHVVSLSDCIMDVLCTCNKKPLKEGFTLFL